MCWPSIFWKLCHLYSTNWWIGAVVLALHLHKTQKLVFKVSVWVWVCVCMCVLEHRFSHQSMSFSQEADMTGQWLFLRLDWTWQGSANLPQSTGTDRKDELYCMTVIRERNYAFSHSQAEQLSMPMFFFFHGQHFCLAVTAMLQSIAIWSPCFQVSIMISNLHACICLGKHGRTHNNQSSWFIYLLFIFFLASVHKTGALGSDCILASKETDFSVKCR